MRASIPETRWSGPGRLSLISRTTVTPSPDSTRTAATHPSPRSAGAAIEMTCGSPPTCCDHASRSASLSATSETRGAAASGNCSLSAVVNAYCDDERGTTSTLVFASLSVSNGLPSATSATTQAIVTIAGCRCTRRVSFEKNPSSGAMSPNLASTGPTSGSRVKQAGPDQAIAEDAEHRRDEGQGRHHRDHGDDERADADPAHHPGLEHQQAGRGDREDRAGEQHGATRGRRGAADRVEPCGLPAHRDRPPAQRRARYSSRNRLTISRP